jgi:hypothetical protein
MFHNKSQVSKETSLMHLTVAEDIKRTLLIKKVEPGLSSYGSIPDKAFASLQPLLVFAYDSIMAYAQGDSDVESILVAKLKWVDICIDMFD